MFSFVLSNATRERDALREKIAEMQPRAAKSETHKAQWNEVAAAVDTSRWPMELLLRCMEPESVKDVALTSFECTSEKIVIQGRTPEITPALKFTEDIKQSEQLIAFQWDSPTPTINSTDNSAAFELRGTLPSTEVKP
jgi:hypothetical protein